MSFFSLVVSEWRLVPKSKDLFFQGYMVLALNSTYYMCCILMDRKTVHCRYSAIKSSKKYKMHCLPQDLNINCCCFFIKSNIWAEWKILFKKPIDFSFYWEVCTHYALMKVYNNNNSSSIALITLFILNLCYLLFVLCDLYKSNLSWWFYNTQIRHQVFSGFFL